MAFDLGFLMKALNTGAGSYQEGQNQGTLQRAQLDRQTAQDAFARDRARAEDEARNQARQQALEEFQARLLETHAANRSTDAYHQGTLAEQAQRAKEAIQARTEEAQRQREFIGSQNEANRANARALIGLRADNAPEKPAKQIPQGVVKTIAENRSHLNTIDDALNGLNDKEAASGLGITNMAGGQQVKDALGLSSAKAQALRATIANVGSLIIHDRSGAAVTAKEMPRLRPFIPAITDPPDVAKVKLQKLRAAIQDESDLYESNFTPDQGYQPFATGKRGGGTAAPGAPPAAPAASGFRPENPFVKRPP